jgi:hypothetical protein
MSMKHLTFFKFFAQFGAESPNTYAITHAALESGFGSSNLAKKHNNYFGLAGKGVKMSDGRHFASYPTPNACIASYQNLIATKYPHAAHAISPSAYVSALIFGGYGGKGFRHTPQAYAYTKQFIAMHAKIKTAQSLHEIEIKTECESAFLGIFLLFYTLLK